MSAATVNPSSAPPHQVGAPTVHGLAESIGHPHHHSDDHPGKNEEMDAEHEVDDLDNSKPRKKRRVIKTSDKKFECPQPDCGKSYSRAEHLYRHQLNHTPKQIYHCDFPGCDRQFVRADLCARHKERHTAKGSHLQRKDAFMNSQRAAAAAGGSHHDPGHRPGDSSPPHEVKSAIESKHAAPPPASSRAPDGFTQQPGMLQSMSTAPGSYQTHPMPDMNSLNSGSGVPSLDPQLSVNASQYSGYPGNFGSNPQMMPPHQSSAGERRFSYDGGVSRAPPVNGTYSQHSQPLTVNAMHPPPLGAPQPGPNMYGQQPQQQPQPPPHYQAQTSSAPQYRPPTSYPNISAVTPYGMPQDYSSQPDSSRSGSVMSPPNMGSNDQFQMATSRANQLNEFAFFDNYPAGFAMPVFGIDYFNRSPPTQIDDNLLSQLLESNGMDLSNPSPPPPASMQIYSTSNTPLPKIETERSFSDEPQPKEEMPLQSPQVNGLNIDIPESDVNVKKQDRLRNLLGGCEDIEGPSGHKLKASVLSGDVSDASHVLSVHMLKTYLTSYWVNIHQQMPILHRPTFNPETCPDLLLLAMICLGACCLERKEMPEMSQVADMAYFTAYHIRWEVFKDVEFRPTAKLWTFQTMLLLELYEKMYSTRTLHERAHIHHATTLTVMRRGSSLIGRSAVESTSGGSDPTRTPPGPDGSINTSGQNTRDAAWNRWITAEATRRVAFAAFVIDSTHATLFGHSAVMAPHDIRLPLPCDEALWSATSMSEVQRVEASLAANGFKPTSFLDGLKKTLNGQLVRTNTFGRGILMAGLLNVSWHMNQRDLQVTSLGASNTLGNPVRWRTPLMRAFDFWRRDFDESLSKNDHWLQVCSAKDKCSIDHRENVFEARTCLHSLAHMAMHVDIVDCEVFAGSDRALGRIVTEADRTAVQRRMREHWAPSARARDATFYAIRFLCEVLIPEDDPHPSNHRIKSTQSPDERAAPTQPSPRPHKPTSTPSFRYSARDDYLLNRPYILYFACMIVWSYGYALDGSLRAPSPASHGLHTREQRAHDMHAYLCRMGSVSSPEDLEKLANRNACLGLLLLLRDCFKEPRWELLHEASDMLGACVSLLVPPPGAPTPAVPVPVTPAPSTSTTTTGAHAGRTGSAGPGGSGAPGGNGGSKG